MPEGIVIAAIITGAVTLLAYFFRGRIFSTPADSVMSTLLELRRQDQERADRLEGRIRELEKIAAAKEKENTQLHRQLEKVEKENLEMRERLGALTKENEYLTRRVQELEAHR